MKITLQLGKVLQKLDLVTDDAIWANFRIDYNLAMLKVLDY